MPDLLAQLIPTGDFLAGFTTCAHIAHPNLAHVELEDAALGAHKVSSRTTHARVVPPGGGDDGAPTTAWEALYPTGSANPSGPIAGGFSLYLSGPSAFAARLARATEAVFSYRMRVQDGWDWVKGGKLPGMYGGVGALAYGCSGGRQEERCRCFSARPMWRPNSIGELYTYLPPTPHNAERLSAVPPRSVPNADYGFSVGRGSFRLERAVGGWVTIAMRVRLNDVGVENGELELYVDGASVLRADGLQLRDSDESKIKGMHFQTFFGGHGAEWASPTDQRAWFADVTGVVLRED